MALQSFTDVSPTHVYYHYIEAIYAARITVGTTATTYGPGTTLTQSQALTFCARGISWLEYKDNTTSVSGYAALHDYEDRRVPPMWTDQTDESATYFGAIQRATKYGVIGGHDLRSTDYVTGQFDPAGGADVTREQAIVFCVRAKQLQAPATPTDDYPTATFGDVATSRWSYWYIEKAFELGITVGTGGGNFSPTNAVTRGEEAVFLQRTFGVPFVTDGGPDLET